MDFNVGKITAIITADITKFKQGISEAKKLGGGLSNEFKTIDDTLGGMGRTFLKIGAVATVAMGAMVTNVALAGAQYKRLEDTLEVVRKNMGLTTDEINNMKTALRDANLQGSDATKTLLSFVQSGLSTKTQMTDFVLMAKDYSASIGVSSKEGVQDFTEAIVTLNPELLKKYRLILNLTQVYAEYAEAHGIQVKEMDAEAKQVAYMEAIYKQHEKTIKGTYKETYDTASKAISSAKDAFASLKDEMGLAFEPALKEIALLLRDTLQGAIVWFQENKEQVKLWGEQIKDVVVNVINFAKATGKWIKDNQTLVKIILGLVASFIALAVSVAIISSVVKTFMTTWKLMKAMWKVGKFAVNGMGTAFTFLTSPMGLVILAIVALIAVGYLLWKNWDWISAKAKELGEWIKNGIGSAIESVKASFDSMKQKVSDFATALLQFLQPAITFLSEVWQAEINKWLAVWNFFAGAFKAVWDAILYPVLYLIYAVFKTIFDQIGKQFDNFIVQLRFLLEPFVVWFNEQWTILKDNLVFVWNTITEYLTETFGFIFNEIITPFVTWVTEKFNILKENLIFVWNAIKEWAIKVWTAISEWISEKTEGVRAFIVKIWNTLVSNLKYVGNEIFEAITAPFVRAWDKIKEIGQKIKDTASSILDWNERHSPSIMDKVRKSIKDLKKEYGQLDITSMFGTPAILPVGSPVSNGGTNSSVGGINIYMSGSIGSVGEAQRMGEQMGDQIINKLKQNIRF